MQAFIEPPRKIPLFLRLGIWLSTRITGKPMLVARLLAWYPKAAYGSAVLESLVAHHDREIDTRMLKLIRIQASYATACPFCMDMNAFEYEKERITTDEFATLQTMAPLDAISTLNEREKLAIEYTRLISQTPLMIPLEFVEQLKSIFNDREIVILATTAAQVNYWARLCSALGVPPAGFTTVCEVPSRSLRQ
jgi:alkylhydroperoxidase family enzyme